VPELRPEDRQLLVETVVERFIGAGLAYRGTTLSLTFPDTVSTLVEPSPLEDVVVYVLRESQHLYAQLVVGLASTPEYHVLEAGRSWTRFRDRDALEFELRAERTSATELTLTVAADQTAPAPSRERFTAVLDSRLRPGLFDMLRIVVTHCPNGHWLNRAVARAMLEEGSDVAYCPSCGTPIDLRPAFATGDETRAQGEREWAAAERRLAFETALFRLTMWVDEHRSARPTCAVLPHHTALAGDLRKAGFAVLPVAGPSELAADVVLVPGYPDSTIAQVVPDLLSAGAIDRLRLVLVEGDPEQVFPERLRGQSYADLSEPDTYLHRFLELALDLHAIPTTGRVRERLMGMLRSA
jgi:hypothetical protein